MKYNSVFIQHTIFIKLFFFYILLQCIIFNMIFLYKKIIFLYKKEIFVTITRISYKRD